MEKWFQYQLSGLSTRSPDDCCSWTGLDPRKVLKLFLPVEVVKEYPLLFQIDLNESSSKSKWNTRKSWTEELWFCWNIQSQYRTFCLFVISHSFRLSLEPCFHWCLERRLDGPQDNIYFQKHMMTKSFLFSEVGRCLLPWQGWSQGAKVDTVSMDAKVKGSFHSFFALGGWETLAPKFWPKTSPIFNQLTAYGDFLMIMMTTHGDSFKVGVVQSPDETLLPLVSAQQPAWESTKNGWWSWQNSICDAAVSHQLL